jgi:hypothetical protein
MHDHAVAGDTFEHRAIHGEASWCRAASCAIAPGAGKTTYALVAARMALAQRPTALVVVTATHLKKTQWASAAARLHHSKAAPHALSTWGAVAIEGGLGVKGTMAQAADRR